MNTLDQLQGVTFNSDVDTNSFEFNSELGFYVSQESAAISSLKLLGFGAPLATEGGFDLSLQITPITELSDLPKDAQTIDYNGKGVGPRMYNTPQAAHGLTELPNTFGAFTFEVKQDSLFDERLNEGNKLSRIAKHGVRMLKSRNLEKVVADIHEGYGDKDAVLLTQPPRADVRQRVERKVENPEGIPAEFIIIRNAAITLHRVGTARRLG